MPIGVAHSCRSSRSQAATKRFRGSLNRDFLDVLGEFLDQEVRFLVVGAHAMAAHGVVRATGDLDLWVDVSSPGNAKRVWEALVRFGVPVEHLGFAMEELESPGVVWQIGMPPRRIDVLTEIDGVDFEAAWQGRRIVDVEGHQVPVLGLAALRRNKAATGREKDRLDLSLLNEVSSLDREPTQS